MSPTYEDLELGKLQIKPSISNQLQYYLHEEFCRLPTVVPNPHRMPRRQFKLRKNPELVINFKITSPRRMSPDCRCS